MESQLPPPPSPFLSIWLKPRQTIRRIVMSDPNKHVKLLAMLAGIGQALDRAASQNLGEKVPLVAVLALALLLGPIGGLLTLSVGSALCAWAGRVLGGRAPREAVRSALAWSNVPTIAALPLLFPQLLLLGSDLFTSTSPRLEANPFLAFPFLALLAVEIVAGMWSFVILVQTLSEIQGFTTGRTLGSLLLAVGVVVVPIFLCVMVGSFRG